MDFANFASQLNAGTILPEGIVMITLLGVLIVDLILGRTSARWIGYLATLGLTAAIIALYFQWDTTNPIAFTGSFNGDDLSIVFRGIIALSAMATILMSIRYVEHSSCRDSRLYILFWRCLLIYPSLAAFICVHLRLIIFEILFYVGLAE